MVDFEETFQKKLGLPLQTDVPLSAHTTWRIGGLARFFFSPRSQLQLKQAIRLANREELPWYVLGRGSNVLFPDSGYDGLVIKVGEEIGEMKIDPQKKSLYAQAGVPLQRLALKCKENGFRSFNFLYGIPGSCGGGIAMNAGAFGFRVGDFIERVFFIDEDGVIEEADSSQCNFSYRNSLFLNSERTIIGAKFKLIAESDQPDLEEIRGRRANSLPLGVPSAGCVFKNPPETDASAGRLIDQIGCKGLRRGKAVVSNKHANFILNEGGARSVDVRRLIDIIKDKVYKAFGVTLVPEVTVIEG